MIELHRTCYEENTMKRSKVRRYFTEMGVLKSHVPPAVLLATAMLSASSTWAEECKAIQFSRGHNNGTVQGIAPPNDLLCHELTTGAGQAAAIEVSGENVIFSIEDVVDARQKYSFTTTAQTYRILVGQLMRSVSDQPFTLTVSVR